MISCQDFPETVEEFMEEYKMVDTEEVYSNGTEFVPIFRMNQWFEHERAKQEQNYDEWCTDCKEYDRERHCCPRWNRVIREALNDAQPERKTGHWVYDENGMDWNLPAWVCSECHGRNDMIPTYIRGKDKMIKVEHPLRWAGSKYCPNCGAKMESE